MKYWTLLAFALVLALSLPGAGCDPVGTYCVRVTDCDTKAAIVGAHVRAPEQDMDVYSGSNGEACDDYMGSVGDPVIVEVEKPGYSGVTTQVSAPGGDDDGGNVHSAVCLKQQAK